jgi:FPC/CPF motif-containing protein YcgG
MKAKVEKYFKDKVLSENFSCIGAKASIKNSKYQFFLLEKMATKISTRKLYELLQEFAEMRLEIDKRFASFIVCFENHPNITPAQFEYLLWKQLKMLHQIDEFAWDNRVSNDIHDPFFSFSVAGEAYFIVGMCPGHPRKCRDFYYPALVFNSHNQFKYLKEINLFEKIQRTVRLREIQYSGSVNPNLINFSKQSEAIQYSGLKASDDWQCPFHFNNKGK